MTATVERTDLDRTRFFIDNEWVEPRGAEAHRVLEAATGGPLGTAPRSRCNEVVAARRRLDPGSATSTSPASAMPVSSGGGRPASQDRCWFVEPTVFADAVRIANDSSFGLGGSVWTTDPHPCVDISVRVRTDTIGANYYNRDPAATFAVTKDNGIGRELGIEANNPYLEYKSIYASADQLTT